MSKIYVGQDLQLTLETSQTLSSATTLQIRAKKPNDGDVVSEDASVVETTKARASFSDTDLDTAGEWRFQVYAEIDGNKYFGETYKLKVYSVYL